jgi:hypothetical protein
MVFVFLSTDSRIDVLCFEPMNVSLVLPYFSTGKVFLKMYMMHNRFDRIPLLLHIITPRRYAEPIRRTAES